MGTSRDCPPPVNSPVTAIQSFHKSLISLPLGRGCHLSCDGESSLPSLNHQKDRVSYLSLSFDGECKVSHTTLRRRVLSLISDLKSVKVSDLSNKKESVVSHVSPVSHISHETRSVSTSSLLSSPGNK